MTGQEHVRGTVAMVTTLNHTTPFRAYFDGSTWRGMDNVILCVDQPTTLRPLVVLDLPKGARAGWPVLIDAFKKAREATGLKLTFSDLIEQIEAQTKPPKPVEPTGLGAVIEGYAYTNELRPFVRCPSEESPWMDESGNGHAWTEIAVVRVLSEGVTA